MIGLTDTEAKVCAVLLRYAADHYGNHGCNDFRLGMVIPDMHERRELMRDYHTWNGDPEEFDDKEDCDIEMDYALMAYLSAKVGGAIGLDRQAIEALII